MAKVKLERVLLRFEDIFVARPYKNQPNTERFSATLLMPIGGTEAKKMQDAMLRGAKEFSEDKGPALLKKAISVGNVPFSEEPRTDKNGDVYSGFEGMASVSSHNKQRPILRDRDGVTPLVQADGRPYAGAYVHAILDVYWDKRFDRINAKLLGIQFVADGPAFAKSAEATDDDFEAEEEESLV